MIQDNSLVKKILELPVIFDIIISDFGREATNRYLKLIELKEKNIISKILKKNSRVFYDEYRRIMYTVIADLNYFKNAEILKATQENGFISDEILIGLGNTQISNVFFERVTFSVIHNVNLAILHGHNTIRITIPCNSLSFVTESILKILKDEDQLGKFINKYNIEKSAKDAILNCNIFGRTVP
ncbi:MAG TPA: hypothetical protein VK590_13035, partial [Saprospiraceae bacterium]|nr:hypothetical protein [Saprospiraceae bacterium]